jgi:hypothetical protein
LNLASSSGGDDHEDDAPLPQDRSRSRLAAAVRVYRDMSWAEFFLDDRDAAECASTHAPALPASSAAATWMTKSPGATAADPMAVISGAPLMPAYSPPIAHRALSQSSSVSASSAAASLAVKSSRVFELRLMRAVRLFAVAPSSESPASKGVAYTAEFASAMSDSSGHAATSSLGASSASASSLHDTLRSWLADATLRERLIAAAFGNDDAVDGFLLPVAIDVLASHGESRFAAAAASALQQQHAGRIVLAHAPFSHAARASSAAPPLLQLIDADKRVGCSQVFISDMFAKMRV